MCCNPGKKRQWSYDDDDGVQREAENTDEVHACHQHATQTNVTSRRG